MEAPINKTMKDKRKWQLAFRRYVFGEAPGEAYAPYFGLDKVELKKWLSLQFANGQTWENFAIKWQFDHIVPVAYFDFSNEADLLLCWNFVNIRVENIDLNKVRGNRIDIMAVKKYFSDLFDRTGYWACEKMVEKIESIEINNIEANDQLVSFLKDNQTRLEEIRGLNKEEFTQYNKGTPLKDILLEREILKKFGKSNH